VTTPNKVNELADELAGAELTAEQRDLLRVIFRAGAIAELQAAGHHPDTRRAKDDDRSLRIGMLPDDGEPDDGEPDDGEPGDDEPGSADPGGGGSDDRTPR
jgi:hypothetical protein